MSSSTRSQWIQCAPPPDHSKFGLCVSRLRALAPHEPRVNAADGKCGHVDPAVPLQCSKLSFDLQCVLPVLVVMVYFTANIAVDLRHHWLWNRQLDTFRSSTQSLINLLPTEALIGLSHWHGSWRRDEVTLVMVHPHKGKPCQCLHLVSRERVIGCRQGAAVLASRGVSSGIFLLPSLSLRWIKVQSNACPKHVTTNAKYESAQTILLVLAHGNTSSFNALQPWVNPASSSVALWSLTHCASLTSVEASHHSCHRWHSAFHTCFWLMINCNTLW